MGPAPVMPIGYLHKCMQIEHIKIGKQNESFNDRKLN